MSQDSEKQSIFSKIWSLASGLLSSGGTSSYLTYGLCAALVAGSSGIGAYYKNKSSELELKNQVLIQSLAKQNEMIKALELDSKAYKAKLDGINKELDSKYSQVQSAKSLQGCKAKLKELKKTLAIFEGGF